jgi:hypothetical protein
MGRQVFHIFKEDGAAMGFGEFADTPVKGIGTNARQPRRQISSDLLAELAAAGLDI